MSIKPVRAARITDVTGAPLGESRIRRRPRNTLKHDVFEHFLNILRKIHINLSTGFNLRSGGGRPEVDLRYTRGSTKWSAAGAASVYNLRLPTEGLRQGHGRVAGARIVRASPGCRRPLFRRSVACATKGVCLCSSGGCPSVGRRWAF